MLKSTSKIAAHQRKWYGKWHTWAGIFAGSILLIVTLTGALLVYERELDEWFYQDTFTFDDTGGKRLTFQEVHDKVMEQRPDWEIGGVFEYNDSQKAYSMFLFHQNLQVIVDPYTGLITSERVYAKTVMGFIRKLHRTLLIPTWGKYIVGIASLLMVSLMVTGLRLWIPRKWKYVKKRLTIKRGVGFKRQNYDFHNILGFYFSPVIALLALTGVAITFAQYVIIALFIAGLTPPESIESILGRQSIYQEGVKPLTIDEVVAKGAMEIPGGKVRGVSLPHDSAGVYQVSITAPGPSKAGDASLISYDQFSGERVMSTHHDFAHLGKLYLNWVTPIHYGTFGGEVTRVIALLASLAGTVLFATGLTIWWGRWKKLRKKQKQAA